MNKLKALLRSLQLFDSSNKLSLTSIGVMVILVKIAMAPTLDWTTASALLLSLLSYNFKKVLNTKQAQAEAADTLKLSDLENKIQEMNRAFNFKNLTR